MDQPHEPDPERSEIVDNDGSVIGTAEAMDDDATYVSLVRIPRLMC
jgi:hypothetical protein